MHYSGIQSTSVYRRHTQPRVHWDIVAWYKSNSSSTMESFKTVASCCGLLRVQSRIQPRRSHQPACRSPLSERAQAGATFPPPPHSAAPWETPSQPSREAPHPQWAHLPRPSSATQKQPARAHPPKCPSSPPKRREAVVVPSNDAPPPPRGGLGVEGGTGGEVGHRWDKSEGIRRHHGGQGQVSMKKNENRRCEM